MAVGHDDVGAVRLRKISTFAITSSAAGFALILVVYLALHVLLRLWETPVIAKNDVQEAVAAQMWAWGYHPRNPPLHTWLLMGSYSVFGTNLVAHVMLKYTLLGGVYTFAYLCARRLLSTTTLALVAALSMTLLGPLAWTVHTALTHTLLLAVMVLATLWAAMRMTDRRRTTDYVLFGVMIGLGLLAKYSFLLFLAPLLAGMIMQRDLRRALADTRMLLALVVMALVIGAHAIWMFEQRYDFIQFLTQKQHSEVSRGYIADAASGVLAVVAGALTFLAPFILVVPAVFRGLAKASAERSSDWQKALVAICAIGIALLLLDVLVLRATQFELRYFTCALLVAPLAVFQWIDRRSPSPEQLRTLCIAIFATALVGFAGLAARAQLEHRSCNRCWEEMPVTQLTHALRAAGFTHGTIVADHYNLAGNMRLAFTQSRTIAANYEVTLPRYPHAGSCVLVWNARIAGDAVPASIVRYLQHAGAGAAQGQPHYVEAFLHRSSDRIDRFGYLMLPGADGNCGAR